MAEVESQTTKSPLFRLTDLPTEIQEMVWKSAIEQACATFKQRHPSYERIWQPVPRGPYVKYGSQGFTRSENDSFRIFILPLLQVDTFARQIARQHIRMAYKGGMPVNVSIANMDKFYFNWNMFLCMIGGATISDNRLRSQTGLTYTITYPGVLEEKHRQEISFLSNVQFVAVPSATFLECRQSWCCRQLLLRLPHLQTVYLQLDHTHASDYHSNVVGTHPLREYSHFDEMGTSSDGKFTLDFDGKEHDDNDAFVAAYSKRVDETTHYVEISKFNEFQRNNLGTDHHKDWYSVDQWKEHHMKHFVACLKPFLDKGITLVAVKAF